MKKLFLFLLLTPIVFISCSTDDNYSNNIFVKESGTTLKNGKTYKIIATSDNKISYESENEYHAKVSDSGLITAVCIGETNIIVSNGTTSKDFKVTVEPESNLYPEPNLEFGISKNDLVKKLGTPDSETSDGIGYVNYSPNAPIVVYLFDSNNKLKASTIMVKTLFSSELGTFLNERYIYGTSIEEDYTLLFINALKLEDATMWVGASLYDKTYWMCLYAPYTEINKIKSTSDNLNIQSIKRIMDSL